MMTQQKPTFMRWTSRVVMVSLMTMMPLQTSFAGMIEVRQVISNQVADQDRIKIGALIDREDVLKGLQDHGVTYADAKARVSALTNEEAHQIAGRLDQLPAGGEVLGVLLTIFIVLLVTDILGFTKVFPFTRPINR